MLTLTGTVRATAKLGGGSNRKTGEAIPVRDVVQIEGLDSRGLVQLFTLTIPNPADFEKRIGERVSVPVRAWAPGAVVSLAYEAPK